MRSLACITMAFGATYVTTAQVAQIGTTKYTSVSLAFRSVKNGETVKLIKDATLTGKATINANTTVTLDLNGYKLGVQNTVNKSFCVYGNFILTDTKENSTGKIHSTSTTANKIPLISVNTTGTFTIKSGKLESIVKNGTNTIGNNAICVYKGGNIIVSGGEIEAGTYAIAGDGNDTSTNSSITINGGTITSLTDYAIYNPQNGSVTINGGSITGYAGGIAMKRGTLAVNGGTIKSEGKATLSEVSGDGTSGLGNAAINCSSAYSNVATTVIGGEITTEGDATAVAAEESQTSSVIATIAIKGGTFSGETASIEPYVDEGSLTKTEDGKVTVQADYYAAKVGETKYTSLAEAINASSTGNEIKILSDINTPSVSYEVNNKELTFDLNGKTVRAKNIVAGSNTELTFTDATATEAPVVDDTYNVTYDAGTFYGELFAENGGSVTIESGKYIDRSNLLLNAIGDKTGINEVKSTVNVNGGYLESQESTVTARYKGATININGGVMVAKDNAVVAGNGIKGLGGTTINISGGTMIGHIQTGGYVACGVYHPQNGELNISGGKIIALGGAGIVMRSGQLNQTGGEVIATGDASLTGKIGDSRVVVGTTGVIFDRDANYPEVASTKITISGDAKVCGTKAAVEVINTKDVADAEDAVEVKGGTFSSDVSDYCDNGSVAAPNEDGTFGIVTGDLLVVTDNGYTAFNATDKKLEFSLADVSRIAVNANVSDATVKMTGNFKEDKWTSFYVPFDIKLTSDILNKFEFAEIWDTELVNGATTIEYKKLSEGEIATANTPCLIKAKAGSDNILELTGTEIKEPTNAVFDCSTLKQKFTFVGVLEKTTLKDKYGYYLDVDNQTFTATSNASTFVRPTKFYMTIQNRADNSFEYPTEESNAKTVGFRVIGDESTAINEIQQNTNTDKNKVYSIQGVYLSDSINELPSGIYIVNGKKISVK